MSIDDINIYNQHIILISKIFFIYHLTHKYELIKILNYIRSKIRHVFHS